MNVSTQLLDHKALAICTYNLVNKCDNHLWDKNYLCCYYGNKVIHNTCNMAIHDLPDMYALELQACISGKSLMAMLQLLHVLVFTVCPCGWKPGGDTVRNSCCAL